MSDKKYYITIKIAEAGTPVKILQKDYWTGGWWEVTTVESSAGHMWYSLTDKNGKYSYGFARSTDEIGLGGPGGVNPTGPDDEAYAYHKYEIAFEISETQFKKLKKFGEDPKSFGFNMHYNSVGNSCVDFVWKALAVAGLNLWDFQGLYMPMYNKSMLDSLETLNLLRLFFEIGCEMLLPINFPPSWRKQMCSR